MQGKGIFLRPIAEKDTERILRWRNDPEIRKRFLYREPFTREGHERWLREAVQAGRAVQFIICAGTVSGEEAPVGSVYLRDIDWEKGSAEYGVFLGDRQARGRGFGAEAARLMLRHAFETLHLRLVVLRVFADNEAAIASYRRAGFREIRTLADVEATDKTRADMLWMEAYAAEE